VLLGSYTVRNRAKPARRSSERRGAERDSPVPEEYERVTERPYSRRYFRKPVTEEGEMTSKADFTEDEWETLQKGVTGSGLLVSLSDRGFFDTFKEAGALAKHMNEARESHDNDLIRDLAGMRGSGFGLTTKSDEVERETVESLRSAVGILRRKAPDDVEEYRSFVLDVAQSVAAAAKDVGAAETGAIEKVRAALDEA
jgi:hypothetical protein